MIHLQDFWLDLEDTIARAEPPFLIAELLHDHRGLSPHIEIDIADNAAHRELLARALAISVSMFDMG